ncbi:MAG: hypothetical protein M0Z31_15635 [Clostridia bacterium]|nr:hypothetical protein [Clostridia bacterium]
MSEFTFVTLIKGRKVEDIANKLKIVREEIMIFPVSQHWHGVLIENEFENSESLTMVLSKILLTQAFLFINCEDYGWGYTLYDKGREKAHLYISGEEDEISLTEANLDYLIELGGNYEDLNKLKEFVENFYYTPEIDFEGCDYFKKAFGFDNVEYVSYHHFKELPEDKIAGMGVLRIGGKHDGKKPKT